MAAAIGRAEHATDARRRRAAARRTLVRTRLVPLARLRKIFAQPPLRFSGESPENWRFLRAEAAWNQAVVKPESTGLESVLKEISVTDCNLASRSK